VSQPLPLLDDYSLGMRQDISRNQMPRGSVWNLVDYIPRLLGAPLRKRGSWAWGSPLTGGGGYTANVVYAPFNAGAQLLKVNSDGALKKVTSDIAETAIGALGFYSWPAPFYRDKVWFGEYGSVLSYYNGSAIATVAAAPKARHLVAYKDRLVAANGQVGATDLFQRIWFSQAGDPFTWDLTNSFIDATFPIAGLASLRNLILVFGDERTERIIGSAPPTALDVGDMERGPAFNVGCIDARSIAVYGELVLFANGEGIWRTDGSVPQNIIEIGGLRPYWIDLMSTWQPGWTLAAGIRADHYIVSIVDQNGVFQDCLMVHLPTFTWTRLSNVTARMFAVGGAAGELYFASRDVPRLGRLSPIFQPSSALGADANGAVVLPLLETPYHEGPGGLLRWKDLFYNYVLDGSGVGTTPSLDVSVATSPEEAVYTALGSYPAAVDIRRDSLPIRLDSVGLAFKLQQQLASSDTRLYELQAAAEPMEQSRVR
jgi:hypothetical protein